ncbi:MAG: valine--tRNA ligase [Planctomycetes bacterium]|nr:valine--tRNA ligase [Planctomycetota bacterium]
MTESTVPTLPTRYTPTEFEGAIYARWEACNAFAPPESPSRRESFTIMMPPPNVTGVLHMGHALNITIQDIVIRHRRMQGFDALWLPGTDHAGIATQAVVEKKLFQEKGVTREELGRESFLQEIWDWKDHHGNAILSQLRRLGASCDWSRTKFTLDEDMSHAVRVSFVRLWEQGLIYRGARLVNWDCKLQTAVSDDEIEYVARKGYLWHLRYPLVDGSGHLTVATTRPETMLGDTGVAVHPEDPRYKDWVGKKLMLPLVDREIPIVADDTVDAEFGTGAVKLTPGHDPADYERGARAGLPIIIVLDKDGSINENGGRFAGMSREKAREAVVAAMEDIGLLEKVEDHTHNVTISDRSKTPIEPLVSEQWFVAMEKLAEPAIAAAKSGKLKFKPARWEKVYLDWLENVHDWCISRQLWWGHRIPVWYDEDEVAVASVEGLEIGDPHPNTGKPIVRQDEDVLDTWASSWLWPFATLGWPENTEEMLRYYPTQFLSTGRDIIYLWVARMIMAGYAFTEEGGPVGFDNDDSQLCFSTCYIHANVLDAQGKRMSKSAGNGIDPVEMIKQYGADAVRYSLMILTREGQDVKLAANRFELGQRFCNKIWNAARFVLGHLGGEMADDPADGIEDRWIRSRLAVTTEEVGRALESYDFHDAAIALYRFTWDDFCDWYLEAAKRRLRVAEDAGPNTPEAAEAARVRRTLGEILHALLKLLHPFTPYMTEALWGELPASLRGEEELLIQASWLAEAGQADATAEQDFALLQDVVRGFRNVRALLEIPAADQPEGRLLAESAEAAVTVSDSCELVLWMARLAELSVSEGGDRPKNAGTDVTAAGAVFLPLAAETDPAKLRASLEKKLDKVQKGIGGIEKKISNDRFLQNADPDVVASEKQRLIELQQEAGMLEANLLAL